MWYVVSGRESMFCLRRKESMFCSKEEGSCVLW
jgi:hypothetical protein